MRDDLIRQHLTGGPLDGCERLSPFTPPSIVIQDTEARTSWGRGYPPGQFVAVYRYVRGNVYRFDRYGAAEPVQGGLGL